MSSIHRPVQTVCYRLYLFLQNNDTHNNEQVIRTNICAVLSSVDTGEYKKLINGGGMHSVATKWKSCIVKL
jgi:hypothetical protein